MNDAEIEAKIRQAGYDIGWETAPGSAAKLVYALRDGKRHTRPHATLLALAEYLGRIDRPVEFVEDRAALEAAIAIHAEEKNHFVVRRESCRVALFNRNRYVQLVEAAGQASAMYELSIDGSRRTSNSNLPAEVVAAFASEATPLRGLTAVDKPRTP
jgi:hypothetical protein